MAGRTPADAFKAFREPIQRAVACFAHTRVSGNVLAPGRRGVLTLNSGEPLTIKSRATTIEITCSISYEIRKTNLSGLGPWKVSTLGYIHTVLLNGDLAVEFHWHPEDGSNVWYPHVHPRLAGPGRDRGGMHIPSGRVLVEDVLIFAQERGAIPLKDDWEGIVGDIKSRVAVSASWGAPTSMIHKPDPGDEASS